MKASEPKRWVIAVDGGGSKIAIAAQVCPDDASPPDSLDAARLWTFAHCGSAHPTTWNAAQRHLTEAVHTAGHELARSEGDCAVRQVLFALAGAGREADRAKVLEWAGGLRGIFDGASIACVSDIEPLVDYRPRRQTDAQAVNHAVSVAVILGTGSIVAARGRNGRIVRAGGWGPQLGDECSGGALGIAALRRVTEWVDAGSKPEEASPLVRAVLALLPGASDQPNRGDNTLAERVGTASRCEFDRDKLAGLLIETAANRAASAMLAHAVLELALVEKDPDALHLLEPHLQRLSGQIEQVVRRVGRDATELEIVFSGGLAGHLPHLRAAVLDACAVRGLLAQAVVAEPLLAALRMAFVGVSAN